MILKVIISVVFILSGCTALQEYKLPVEMDVTVPEVMELPEIEENKAETKQDKDRKEKIRTIFNDALELTEDAPKDAIRFYKEVIKLAPDRWEPHYNTGIIYMKLYNPEKAIEEFLMALKHNAPHDKVYSALGTVYMTTGETLVAINAFKRVLVHDKSPAASIKLTQNMNKTEEVIKRYYIDPSNQIIHYNIGALLYKTGDYKASHKEFKKALIYDKKDKRILLSQAHTLLKLKEYEAALKVFQEITTEDPVNPGPYKDMGIIYELYLGDMEKALESYTNYIAKGGKRKADVEVWIDVLNARLGSKEK